MKRFFQILGLLIVVCVGIILIRTVLVVHPQHAQVPHVENIPIQGALVANHLSGAIKFQTISNQDSTKTDPEPFIQFQQYLRTTFPLVHQNLEIKIIHHLGLLYQWKGSDPDLNPVLLTAHQDVVPVSPLSRDQWVYPPFSGDIEEGYIWGRGTLDDKGSLMGILEAVELLLSENFQPRRTLYLAFGQDEEVGGSNGAAAIARYLKNADVPVEYVLDEGGMITKNIVPDVTTPVALIGTAEKGYVSLQLAAKGNEGHSSMPPEFTSIGRVSRAITELEENPFPATLEYAKPLLQTVAPEMPFFKKMVVSNLWIFSRLLENIYSQSPQLNAIIRTTTAPTIFQAGIKDNILPGEATAVVNFRILPGETMESVQTYVVNKIEDPLVEVTTEPFGENPSPVSGMDNSSFHTLKTTILQTAGPNILVAPYLVLGATDSRYYSIVSKNIYRFLPISYTSEDLDRMHGVNERIGIDNYVRSIQFYYQLIKNSQLVSKSNPGA